MDAATLKTLARLEALSRVSLAFISKSVRSEDRAIVVSLDAEIKDGAILTSMSASGPTIEDALQDLWFLATNLPPQQYIVVNTYESRGPRTAWRWDPVGELWARQDELPSVQREGRIKSPVGLYGGRDK